MSYSFPSRYRLSPDVGGIALITASVMSISLYPLALAFSIWRRKDAYDIPVFQSICPEDLRSFLNGAIFATPAEDVSIVEVTKPTGFFSSISIKE